MTTGASSYLSILILSFLLLANSQTTRAEQSDGEFLLQSGQLGVVGGISSDSQFSLASQIGYASQKTTGSDYALTSPVSGAGLIDQIKFSSGLKDTMNANGWTLGFSLPIRAASVACSLSYRPGGLTTFTTASIEQESDTFRSIRLLPDSIGLRGLEYFVTLSAGPRRVSVGTESRPLTVPSHVLTFSPRTTNDNYALAYQLFSLPFRPDGEASDMFVELFGPYDPTEYRLGRYDPDSQAVTEFPNIPAPSPGNSYWLIRKSSDPVQLFGVSVSPSRRVDSRSYYPLQLDSGWNQLANPFAFNIGWKELRIESEGQLLDFTDAPVDDSVFGYFGNRFRTLTVLNPWSGFFLYADKPNLTLLFPFEEFDPAFSNPVARNSTDPARTDWHLKLSLTTGDGMLFERFVGVHPEAEDGADRFDQRVPPHPMNQSPISLEPAGLDGTGYRSDFREPGAREYVFMLHMNCSQHSSLRLIPSSSFPANFSISLRRQDGPGIEIFFEEEILLQPGRYELQLVVARRSQETSVLPTEFALHQNYPNPFNPTTTIRYDLPHQTTCLLEIVNILGRTVFSQSQPKLAAGRYQFVWDGRNSVGAPVASGLYFFRIRTDQFTASKKMILLR
ncbi:MAG: T9SS type A sorting domain-containing protein [bacterium]|nr:T9SS type A sorting domain-containing protein [bacterium]